MLLGRSEEHFLVFVANVGDYHRATWEDGITNIFDDCLDLIQTYIHMINLIPFTRHMVVLNKTDLLVRNLAKIPFRVDTGPSKRFVDYEGPSVQDGASPEMVSEYIIEYFEDKLRRSLAAVHGNLAEVKVCALSALNQVDIDKLLVTPMTEALELRMLTEEQKEMFRLEHVMSFMDQSP